MGKKKRENRERRKGTNKAFWLAGLLVALAAGLFAWGWVKSGKPGRGLNSDLVAPGEYVRRETRPALSPALFVGKAARAYQVAQEIPDVLDQLYCYCGCDQHMGHVSLLSCFTDRHGAT